MTTTIMNESDKTLLAKKNQLDAILYSMKRDKWAMLGLARARSINQSVVKSDLSEEVIQQALSDMYKYFEDKVESQNAEIMELLKGA